MADADELPPGDYTVSVEDFDSATGTAIMEVQGGKYDGVQLERQIVSAVVVAVEEGRDDDDDDEDEERREYERRRR